MTIAYYNVHGVTFRGELSGRGLDSGPRFPNPPLQPLHYSSCARPGRQRVPSTSRHFTVTSFVSWARARERERERARALPSAGALLVTVGRAGLRATAPQHPAPAAEVK